MLAAIGAGVRRPMIPGGDEANLRALLRAARSAQARISGRARGDLVEDVALCNAIVHRVERIEDTARCVSLDTRARFGQVPWPLLDTLKERTRRVVEAGEVATLDPGHLWDVVQVDLPAIVASIERALAKG